MEPYTVAECLTHQRRLSSSRNEKEERKKVLFCRKSPVHFFYHSGTENIQPITSAKNFDHTEKNCISSLIRFKKGIFCLREYRAPLDKTMRCSSSLALYYLNKKCEQFCRLMVRRTCKHSGKHNGVHVLTKMLAFRRFVVLRSLQGVVSDGQTRQIMNDVLIATDMKTASVKITPYC